MIKLHNVNLLQKEYSLISKTKIRGNNSRPRYRLYVTLKIQLSNGMNITIPEGFEWDLSTAPRFAWSLLPPDGDFELAYLIHDFLWINKEEMATHFEYYDMNFNQKFTDDEMLKWAKVTNGIIRGLGFSNEEAVYFIKAVDAGHFLLLIRDYQYRLNELKKTL
jgi:hypothetical protein